jgi:hypothetical protein
MCVLTITEVIGWIILSKGWWHMFDDIANLFLKNKQLRDPKEYDKEIYQISRLLAMENELTIPLAFLSKYIWVLRGRYYLLLWGLIPKTSKKLWLKNVKRGLLEDAERQRVRAVQALFNYGGKEAFIAKEILEREGVSIDKLFGVKNE